jgi:hypothetical protein
MTQTPTLLEKITDAAKFESLATAVLRRAQPNYASIIHTGINAEGKPVPGSVDGIGFVPGSNPPHLIMLQHTTIALSGLRKKWTGREGDIAKAVTIATQERERFPNTRVTLALVSNRTPDEHLIREANAQAVAAGIDLDIWDRSRLAEFLDTDPHGQWLRKDFLGIDQGRLSPELLAAISGRNAQALRDTVLDDSNVWIDRSLDQELAQVLGTGRRVTFLIMPSGAGKTTALAQLLTRWTAEGRFGVWIAPTVVERSVTLREAVDSVLRAHEPALEPDAGNLACELSTPKTPLLVIVDDVNRTGAAAALVERLATWGTEGAHLICPVWPQTIEQLSEAAQRRILAQSIVHGRFDEDEAVAAVQRRALQSGRPLSDMEAAEIGAALAYDPLLIALASAESSAARPVHAVIPSFIAEQIRMLAAAPTDGPVSNDYHRALDALAWRMLTHRQMAPLWSDIVRWYPDTLNEQEPLRRLCRQRTVCHLEESDGDQRLMFRHDRVRNVVLAATIARRLKEDSVVDEVIADPFYAEVIGIAISNESVRPDQIARLAAQNPLALFHAIRFVPDPSDSHGTNVIEAIVTWLGEHPARRENKHLRWAMQVILASMDHPIVCVLAARFREKSRALTQACFRNGDIRSGAAFCYRYYPGMDAPSRDVVIRHTSHRIGEQLLTDLASLLMEPDLEQQQRVGALYLAGHLASPLLNLAIERNWRLSGRSPETLPAFLWAACCCASTDSVALIGAICDYWAELPEREQGANSPPHRHLPHDHGIHYAFRRSPPVHAIPILIEQAQRPELRWPIISLLDSVDDPTAVLFLAREHAEIARASGTTESSSLWLLGGWPDKVIFGTASRAALQELWRNSRSDSHLRRAAFSLWSLNAMPTELPLLQEFDEEDSLYDRILQSRIRLQDHSAIPKYRAGLQADTDRSFWWQFGRYFWCQELTEQLEQELQRRSIEFSPTWENAYFQTDWIVSELLQKLEPHVASNILHKHWGHLRFQPRFVQAALFVATDTCCALARDAIEGIPDPREALKYIDHSWRLGGTAERGRLSLARLAAIEPYLSLLDDSVLGSFWTACNVDGFVQWRRLHLDHRTPNGTRRFHGTTDEDLFNALDELAAGDQRWSDFWLEQFDERHDPPDRAFQVLRRWLDARRTPEAFEIVAECIALRGRRQDIDILDNFGHGGTELAAIRKDTLFAVWNRTLS